MGWIHSSLSLYRSREGSFHPGTDLEQGAITESLPVLTSKPAPRKGRKDGMRVAVVESRGVPLMLCHPGKARLLLKAGKARPKRDKLGLFFIQLSDEQEPNNQPLAIGIDPGSKFEGFSVVGTRDTVTNLMVEAPDHVKKAVEVRRTMRRARRQRKWRRP